MTIVREIFLICNGRCGRSFGVDMRQRSGQEQRAAAKKEGWKRSGGFDYCPECWTKIKVK